MDDDVEKASAEEADRNRIDADERNRKIAEQHHAARRLRSAGLTHPRFDTPANTPPLEELVGAGPFGFRIGL
jgi:hypothetical protein